MLWLTWLVVYALAHMTCCVRSGSRDLLCTLWLPWLVVYALAHVTCCVRSGSRDLLCELWITWLVVYVLDHSQLSLLYTNQDDRIGAQRCHDVSTWLTIVCSLGKMLTVLLKSRGKGVMRRVGCRGLHGGQNSYPPPPRENNWTPSLPRTR